MESNSDTTPKSALRSSIDEFGTNSYYYAHNFKFEKPDHAVVIEGPGLVTGGAPVLLSVAPSESVAEKPCKAITSYAWADEDEKVRIYINLTEEGDLTQLPASAFTLDYSSQSFDIRVAGASRDYRFKVDRLCEEIDPSGCSHRVKSDKVVVTLKKQMKISWKDLAKK
eukprot:GILI01018894.1.p2 GENE.GILI01018894.1~~GILI01018894.1.p2  ORF type:complete len:168 (+),score=50.82 GILI01018894.1:84-587(+)